MAHHKACEFFFHPRCPRNKSRGWKTTEPIPQDFKDGILEIYPRPLVSSEKKIVLKIMVEILIINGQLVVKKNVIL